MHPRLELGLTRLPAWRFAPNAQEHLLRYVLSLRMIAQQAPRDAHHFRQMTAHEYFGGALVARPRIPDEFSVRIDHARSTDIALRQRP